MIEDMIEELSKLCEYKNRYEDAQQDKQYMSDMLYTYMLKEYESTSYKERCKKFCEEMCCRCANKDYCPMSYRGEFPQDILMPIKSAEGRAPKKKSCGNFVWG